MKKHFLSYFSDVISIQKTGEFFRLIYDVKGRFTIHRITNEESKVSNLDWWSHVYYLYLHFFGFYETSKVKTNVQY